jgi:hypothetical protein
MLLKYAEVSEKEFENQSIEDQEKSLRKGMNKYLQARKIKESQNILKMQKGISKNKRRISKKGTCLCLRRRC